MFDRTLMAITVGIFMVQTPTVYAHGEDEHGRMNGHSHRV